MKTKFYLLKITIALGLFCVAPLGASDSVVKHYRTMKDFIKGKTSGITIQADGTLKLAPETRHLTRNNMTQIWQIVRSGNQLYAAGGTPAMVISFTEKGDTTTVYRGEETTVFAMSSLPDGRVLFAPSPGGDIYEISNGQATKKISLGATYVWDILPVKDAYLVATGDPATIFKVSNSGVVDTFFVSSEMHIRTLAKDHSGVIYAGSAEKGIIYKFGTDGKPTVFYDTRETEILKIIPAGNGIWAAAREEGRSSASRSTPAPNENSNTADSGKPGPKIPTLSSTKSRSTSNGAVYYIGADGVARNYWTSGKGQVQSMLKQDDGSLLLGAGTEGKLYVLNKDVGASQLLDFDEDQITEIYQHKGQVYVGTSNPGSSILLQKGIAARGEYISPAFDAKLLADWGSISWKGKGSISFFVRSGNSADPDNTWGGWQGPYTNQAGSQVTAGAARYLQWKAVFENKSTRSPELDAVDFGYRQVNVGPVVEKISVYPPGVAFPAAVEEARNASLDLRDLKKQKSGTGTLKDVDKKGYQSIRWKATDGNNDILLYSIFYKKTDTKSWKKLIDNYIGKVYSWDSQAMEDGEYSVKIVTSDHLSNSPDNGLKSEKMSTPFVVDNTPPHIIDLKYLAGAEQKISFTVNDLNGRITECYFSINAGSWQHAQPRDGILDSRTESFLLELGNLIGREHTIMIKAFDENENVKFAHLNFTSTVN